MSEVNSKYQICTKCVMDTSSSIISFDKDGVCNFCKEYKELADITINRPASVKQEELQTLVSKIKEEGKGKPYDCIIGLSGGVDSSYVAYLVKELGLRPLAVHFDNGWNSELAVKNIENILNACGFDLQTYVANWDEFRDLQVAYLKASVIDIEVLSDHMIVATLYKLASKYKVDYIIGGTNVSTEAILPSDWVYRKTDLVNLLNIHKKFGKVPLKKYPKIGFFQRMYYNEFKNIRFVEILNLVPYNKHDAKKLIIDKFGWRDYGGKHYESNWTKFYQGYILPKKFGVDKRKAHLATLINSGQLTREEALAELAKPSLPPDEEKQLVEYVCVKLGLSLEEFNRIMSEKPIPHQFYGTEKTDKKIKLALRVINFFLWRIKKRLIYLY